MRNNVKLVYLQILLINSIPEFKELIEFLNSHNLDEPVWKVLGGSPVDYLTLKNLVVQMLSLPHTASDVIVNQVKNHLQSVLSESLNNNVGNSSSNTQEIIKVFREKKVTKIAKMEPVSYTHLTLPTNREV